MTLAGFLAWPDGSGLVGTALLGGMGYVHTHVRLGRQHREQMAQAERLAAGAGAPVINITKPGVASAREFDSQVRGALRRLGHTRPGGGL